MSSVAVSHHGLLRQYVALTKPRVTQLAVFCAVIGMFLATPGWPDMRRGAFATGGIWLLAAAAFAINCLLEQEVDARMLRTARRATARGTISATQVLTLSGLLLYQRKRGCWCLLSLSGPPPTFGPWHFIAARTI